MLEIINRYKRTWTILNLKKTIGICKSQYVNFLADQDLPNNMIHQVAIKSLPQEWLWCETWCDESSKKFAKTIDLVSTNRNLILN